MQGASEGVVLDYLHVAETATMLTKIESEQGAQCKRVFPSYPTSASGPRLQQSLKLLLFI